ncbi:chaperone protein ClpB1 [Ziziphus jujuba]|uniref:Chaperone protein ClpB1 n=1 Tax=Ziziphus jujuba TaxID=326968 RepID=A0ABM4A0U9_ZIZJJ|nr:chaperone protein ClpB1 [Ziziphus jujuba]
MESSLELNYGKVVEIVFWANRYGIITKPSSAQLIGRLQVEDKQKLEQIYCLHIHPKALVIAACIAIKYTDILLPQSKAHDYKSCKSVQQQLAGSEVLDWHSNVMVTSSYRTKIFSEFHKQVVGQEFTKFAITTTLLNHRRSASGPCGPLLFLYGPGCGRTELAKAIAEQVFDDKDMLTEFDMSKYMNPDSHSTEPGFREQLIEVVKKRPFGVVLLDNIEMDVYLMGRKIENFPRKELGDEEHLLRLNDCRHISILAEAKRHFRTELIEKLYDVIALEPLSFLQYKCITRHLLRDIECSFAPKRTILCPSEAAVGVIVFENRYTNTKRSRKNIRIWLENNVTPVIQELLTTNQIDDTSGTKDLSYRCEKNGTSEYQDLTDFLMTFNELRIAYYKEKKWVKQIYMLR